MARYIEAVNSAEIISKELNIPLGDLVDVFATIPTADVEEVKHGEWLWVTEDIYECSNCGIQTKVDEVLGMPTYKRCTYCGAKMDGGKTK